MPRPGAPALLETDPMVRETILEALRAGNYLETAASLAGVTPQAVRAWLRRGRGALRTQDQGLGYHESDRVYAEFVSAVDQALAEAESKDVKALAAAAENPAYWRAAAWRLAHRHPDRWGRTTMRVEHDVTDEAAAKGADLVRSLRGSPEGRRALEALHRSVESLTSDDGGGDDPEGAAQEAMEGRPPSHGGLGPHGEGSP